MTKMFTRLAVALIAAASLTATTIDIPVLSPDGQNLAATNPGIGQKIYAFPGSEWLFGFNDNYGVTSPGDPTGDFDFNDAMGTVSFSSDLLGYVLGQISYVGSASADVNKVGYSPGWGVGGVGTVLVETGSELTLQMWDKTTGKDYVTGTQNAWVMQAVPEPGVFFLVGLGLAVLSLGKKRL